MLNDPFSNFKLLPPNDCGEASADDPVQNGSLVVRGQLPDLKGSVSAAAEVVKERVFGNLVRSYSDDLRTRGLACAIAYLEWQADVGSVQLQGQFEFWERRLWEGIRRELQEAEPDEVRKRAEVFIARFGPDKDQAFPAPSSLEKDGVLLRAFALGKHDLFHDVVFAVSGEMAAHKVAQTFGGATVVVTPPKQLTNEQ